MLISIRTLINTTLFWIFIVFGFRLYTKYDPTPAKYLLYTIGRANLGNIEIITPSSTNNINTGTIEYLSNQLIAERLYNIEQLCGKSIRLPLYEQNITTNNTNQTLPIISSNNSTGIINQGTNIPVIDNSNLLRNNSSL